MTLLETIPQRGRVRIAAHWELTAEQYLDPDSGEPAGVVGKVGAILARDLGVEPEFVGLSWDGQLTALLAGEVDICLKHTNTPQRAFHVDFARGGLERYEGRIVVRRERDWDGEAALDDAGRVVAAIGGSHQEAQAGERYPRATVLAVATEHEGMEAVQRGDADACLGDAWVPNFLRLRPECELLRDGDGEPILTSVDYGHPCIRKGDPEFLNWLDNWMDFHGVQGTFQRAIEAAYREHAAKADVILAGFLERSAAP